MAEVETENETDAEVEAAIAVYGSDCIVLQRSPPHLLVRLKPRTADDISQQVFSTSSFLSFFVSPFYTFCVQIS